MDRLALYTPVSEYAPGCAVILFLVLGGLVLSLIVKTYVTLGASRKDLSLSEAILSRLPEEQGNRIIKEISNESCRNHRKA